jgi:lipid-binding SYLF domain-containing protein
MKTDFSPALSRASCFRLVIFILAFVLVQVSWAEDRDKLVDRVNSAGTVLQQIMAAPDSSIPDEILGSAQCVAVVPSLLKGGFIVGGSYGNGVASCRTPKGWSAPAFFRVEGGSFGLQIGGQAVDLVMVIMNDKGMRDLLEAKFKLGADASVAAGPVGRLAEGSTDWKMRAEVLTYSRARGVFAGITLNGAVIRQDRDDTRDFYGRMVPYKTILTGAIDPPSDSQPFLSALNKYAPNKGSADQSAAQKSSSPSAEPAANSPEPQPKPETPPHASEPPATPQ